MLPRQVPPPIWVHSEPVPHWTAAHDGRSLCRGDVDNEQYLEKNTAKSVYVRREVMTKTGNATNYDQY